MNTKKIIKPFISGIFVVACCISSYAQVYELNAASLSSKKMFQLPFSGNNFSGEKLSVNNIYLEKNGKPWYPLMGEFHYWRFPATYWEEQIIKMKSAGMQIVATYVYWGAHEKPQGVWNWNGTLKLRHFIELCKKHGMYVWLRPGPYINADVRGRGFPDWIDHMKGKRSNAPKYLAEVDKYFAQLGEQTKGTYYTEGGPVIGVQLENEYASGDKTHIAKLKEIAMKYGVKPVYWSVTANSVFQTQKMEVLPLQGAYCYRGWEPKGKLTIDFLYGEDQWIMDVNLGGLYYPLDSFPRVTCEQGSGMQETFGGRFIVKPSVIEAHVANQYGRGINMLGYFMFQGGTQYPGTELPLNDGKFMPSGLVSYNYQAPLGEFGEVNESYRFLKMHHLFLNDFGDRLVPMQFIAQPHPIKDPADITSLRYAGRFNTKGEGFLFICNTQNYKQMTDKKMAFNLSLPGNKKMQFPAKEVTIKDNRIAAWPVNFNFNGINIQYATANVLCKIDTKEASHLFLYETEGISPEISLDASAIRSVNASGWDINKRNGENYLLNADKTGLPVTIIHKNGKKIIIHVLSRNEAEHAWKYSYAGQEYLIISDADLMFTAKGIEAKQFNNPSFTFKTLPQANFVKGKWGKANVDAGHLFYQYNVEQKTATIPVNVEKLNDSSWIVKAKPQLPSQISDVFLAIDFKGNLIKAQLKDSVVADQLYIGQNWMVGLKRFLPLMQKENLQLNTTVKNIYGKDADAAIIKSIKVLPQYNFKIEF